MTINDLVRCVGRELDMYRAMRDAVIGGKG